MRYFLVLGLFVVISFKCVGQTIWDKTDSLFQQGTVTGDFHEANQGYQQYFAGDPFSVDDSQTVFLRYDKYAQSCYYVGNQKKCVAVFDSIIDLFAESSFRDSLSNANGWIAFLYQMQGKFEKSIRYNQRALIIAQRAEKRIDIAAITNNLGLMYSEMGLYDKAITNYSEAKEIVNGLADTTALSTILGNIGLIYYSWGQPKKAIQYFEEAFQLISEKGKPNDKARILANLGAALGQTGMIEEGSKKLDEALELYKRSGNLDGYAKALNNTGTVHFNSGKYEEAYTYFWQAYQISDSLANTDNRAVSSNNIGVYFEIQKKYRDALRYYIEAMKWDDLAKREASLARDYYHAGRCYSALNELDSAVEYFNRSIAIKERIRKTATGESRRDYLESQTLTYRSLAEVYFQMGEVTRLYEIIEFAKAKQLAEQLSGSDLITILKLKDFQATLEKDEAVLEYFFTENKNLLLLYISSDSARAFSLDTKEFDKRSRGLFGEEMKLIPGYIETSDKLTKNRPGRSSDIMKEVQCQVELLRDFVRDPGADDHTRKLARLFFSYLLESASGYFQGVRKLTIVPDGVLALIPFEILVDSSGKYLVENYNVGYSQTCNVRMMLEGRSYPDNRKPLLAIGGAPYEKDHQGMAAEELLTEKYIFYLKDQIALRESEDMPVADLYEKVGFGVWGEIPGTLEEVIAIKSLVEGSDVLVKENASEGRVKGIEKSGDLKKYRIIHFSTHGVVVNALPELSAIVLSQTGDSTDDGYLRVSEVRKLKLEADLVNLSGCETGMGKVYNSEGVVGLTHAFLVAGANAVIASFWQVADKSTATFMVMLYEEFGKQQSYCDALSQVKRDFISGKVNGDWNHPFHWAPFIYFGK
ncbi:MAG: CHAT domain-containing protein [Bacteroidetes bacterium]|nr:CHAT domain-containing protein [Bacteroidota bacterium]MBU1720782.1 CHAT domain-containing protein [Bacteroidota bacterium]